MKLKIFNRTFEGKQLFFILINISWLIASIVVGHYYIQGLRVNVVRSLDWFIFVIIPISLVLIFLNWAIFKEDAVLRKSITGAILASLYAIWSLPLRLIGAVIFPLFYFSLPAELLGFYLFVEKGLAGLYILNLILLGALLGYVAGKYKILKTLDKSASIALIGIMILILVPFTTFMSTIGMEEAGALQYKSNFPTKERAVETNNLTLCDEMEMKPSKKSGEWSTLQCYAEIAELRGDSSICDDMAKKMHYYKGHMILSECYVGVVKKTSNIELCQKVELESSKLECYAYVAAGRNNASICELSTDPETCNYYARKWGGNFSTT